MATKRLCSIAGCDKLHSSHGYCKTHADSFRRHGNALTGRSGTGRDVAKTFFRETVLSYDGDDCLIWPFGRSPSGYAQLTQPGLSKRVSHVVCEITHGPPPTPEHDAAHSCGNGCRGCVSKRHLSWKTKTENAADMKIHGTVNRGEKHGNSKLTENAVREIRASIGREPIQAIADRFGVNYKTVWSIDRGRLWGWLT